MVSNKGNGNQATVTLKSEPIKCEVSPQAKPEMPIKSIRSGLCIRPTSAIFKPIPCSCSCITDHNGTDHANKGEKRTQK